MPRKKGIPSLRYPVSGQSVVTFCGVNSYLGPHGTAEAQARYHSVVSEYVANGMKAPPEQPVRQNEAVITVAQVCAESRAHIKVRYASNRQEHGRMTGLCWLLETEHGDVTANQFVHFGPRRVGDRGCLDTGVGRRRPPTSFRNSRRCAAPPAVK